MTTQVNHATITMRDGFDARLLLSYGRLPRSIPRSTHVLELGCSTGEDLANQARLQADVLFTGVDANAGALEEARRRAAEQSLTNLDFVHADLADFSTIPLVDGGYDLVYVCSLPTDETPGAYLARVERLLAPHGLISITLPGRRAHFATVAAAIDGVAPRSKPLRERLEAARDHVDRLVQEHPTCPDWRRAALVDDAEFVDRYMGNAHQQLDVAATFSALEEAGLSFVRWHDTAAWSFENLELEAEELERVRGLSTAEQAQVVEAQRDPEQLSLVVGRADNGPRGRFDLTKAGETHFMVHPEVTFTIDCRNFWGSTQYEGLKVRRGNEEPVEVRPSPALTALFALRNQREPFSGLNLVEVMTAEGADLEEALLALHQLVGLELIYRPHEFDVAQFYAAMLRAQREVQSDELGSQMVVTPTVPRELDELPQPLPAEAGSETLSPKLPSAAEVLKG